MVRTIRQAAAGWRSAPGFTLLELMVVTAIVSLLVMVAAGPITKARDKGMVGAVKMELSNTMKAINMYESLHGEFPASLGELEEVGFEPGRTVKVCMFNVNQNRVRLQFQHKGSKTRVEARYPRWGPEMEETPNVSCNDIRDPKPKKNKKKK